MKMRQTYSKKKSFIPMAIGGLGLVILIIVMIRLFAAPQNAVDPDYVQSLETRIIRMENQLLTREALDEVLEKIDRQESQLKSMGKKLNRFESTVTPQIDQIIKEIGVLHQNREQKSTASAPKPQTAAKQQPAATPQPKSTATVHVVQSGETLYRISRRYGLTVAQLRSYNDLASNAAIYPGQKLKLSPNENH